MPRGVLSTVTDRPAHAEQPVFWHHELEAFGTDELRGLLGARVLVRVKDATKLRCPSHCGKGCGLHVLSGRELAVCPESGIIRLVAILAQSKARWVRHPSTAS